MGKNRRLAQMGIATTLISEEASVVVIWQALAKHLGSLRIFGKLALLFLRLAFLPLVPSAQLGQFTIPGPIRIEV